jgi:hypothetical protein
MDEQPRHVTGERQEKNPQADVDFQHLAERLDRPVADSQPVAFFGGKVFAGLPGVQMADAAGGLVAARRFGVRAAQQVEVVVCLLLELCDNSGQLICMRCGGQCRPDLVPIASGGGAGRSSSLTGLPYILASLTSSSELTSRVPFSIAISSGRLTPSSAAACA